MIDHIPDRNELRNLIGPDRFEVWQELLPFLNARYDMECTWNSGGKKWDYEYKYRRGGKTLCAVYFKGNCLGFMVIFGKKEREKFETERSAFSAEVQSCYDEATTYHDGKWMMLHLEDTSLFQDIEKLLLLKRKPNRK